MPHIHKVSVVPEHVDPSHGQDHRVAVMIVPPQAMVGPHTMYLTYNVGPHGAMVILHFILVVNVSIGVQDPQVIPVVTPKNRPRKNNLKKINPEHLYRVKTAIQNH